MQKLHRFFLLLFLSVNVFAQGPKNLTLLGTLNVPGQRLSGCWHYASGGSEYALIGAENGIIIADVTTGQPVQLFQLPGVNSLWHEVKVVGEYAYAVSEGSDPNNLLNGVQIIDLRFLPDSAPSRFYQGDGSIQNQLITAHSITAEGNYIYVNGHNNQLLNRGVLILDVTDPINPVYTGAITLAYCHDSYVRGNRIYTSDIIDGMFSVYDISNPATPQLIARQPTPGTFNHNTWLNDAGTVLFTTDERGGEPLGAFDISDLTNITLIDTFFNGNFKTSEVHNVRVINDYLINPSYGSQLTIADGNRPGNLIEVANFTTGSSLCWDADPYLPSGKIISTDMNSGDFFVFQPTYVRACYLEGQVTDSITGSPINNAAVILSSINISANADLLGNYRTGYADSGLYSVRFMASGYTDEIRTVQLNNGLLTKLNVKLKQTGSAITDQDDAAFSLYPNPAHDFIQVSSSRKISGYSIYDMTGQRLLWKEVNSQSDLTILLEELATGVYTLKLDTESGMVVKQITIQ